MGLDQYLFKQDAPEEIGTWRKQSWLNQYMYNLWEDRTDNTFNMQRLSLSLEDIKIILDKLQDPDSDIHPDEDFLANNKEWYEEELPKTINYFQDALADTQSGKQIFYTNWW